jgi:hypothetical protein
MTKAPALGPPTDVTLITSRAHPRARARARITTTVLPCTAAALPAPGCALFRPNSRRKCPSCCPTKRRGRERLGLDLPSGAKGCSKSLRRLRGDCCEDAQARPYFNVAAEGPDSQRHDIQERKAATPSGGVYAQPSSSRPVNQPVSLPPCQSRWRPMSSTSTQW